MQALSSQNEWENKPQVIKGNFAEEIVRGFLERAGYIVYAPQTDGAHGFDRLAVKNKKEMVICEVKAKTLQNNKPVTGINLNHFNEYVYISEKHNIPVFLFFVDEMIGKIYGNKLEVLKKSCTEERTRGGVIVYFHYKDMKTVVALTEKQIEFLIQSSTRNFDYKPAYALKDFENVDFEKLNTLRRGITRGKS